MVQGANAPIVESPYDSDKHSIADIDPSKPYPTEEEWATLPKVAGSIPWTAWTVAVCEFAERFSYYGTTAVCKFTHKAWQTHSLTYDVQSSTSFKRNFQ